MSEIKQNITNELSEEELENVAGGFGRPTMDDPRYREQMRINVKTRHEYGGNSKSVEVLFVNNYINPSGQP